MEIERKIFRNTFVMTLAQAIIQLLNFLFVVYFARKYGAGVLGNYSFAMAIAALSCIFVSLGTHTYALKNISQDISREKKIIGLLVPFELITGVSILILAHLVFQYIPMSENLRSFLFLLIAYRVILKWLELFCVRFQAREQMHYIAYVEIIRQISLTFFGFVLIWKFDDPVFAITIFPFFALITTIGFILASFQKFGSIPFNFRLQEAKELMLNAWPYFAIIIIGILYGRIGIVLLTYMQSDVEVGYFASAERLVTAAGIVHAMFIGAMSPAINRLAANEKESISTLAMRCLRLLFVFILPVAVLLFLFSGEIIKLLFGVNFVQSIIVLQIVSWALIFRGLNSYLTVLAIAEDYQANLSKAKLFALLFFMLTAIPLVYYYSYVGLAISVLISDIFLTAVLFNMLIKIPYFLQLFVSLWKPIVACTIVFFAGMLVSQQPIFLKITILLLTLLLSLIISGAIKIHDLMFMRDILFPTSPKTKQ